MSRPIRAFTRPRPTTVEIVQKTFQSRYLLRPDRRFNGLIVGAMARAQKTHGPELHGVVVLSNHLHLLATFEDAKQMADFMRDFTQALAAVVQEEHRWKGTVFPRRYRHIELSEEPEAELDRMRYLLSNSCKENLVSSPLDWPGVSSAEALVSGQPMVGRVKDRRAPPAAGQTEIDVFDEGSTEEVSLKLRPLPAYRHLGPKAYRQLMLSLVREVELEASSRHRNEGTRPLGVDAILAQDPRFEPEVRETSPCRWFHTATLSALKELKEAMSWIMAAYREAAERLKRGEREVEFPVHTFPPGLPFTRPRAPT